MRYLNRYAPMFAQSIYICAEDVSLVTYNTFADPDTTYENFLLDFATRNPANCISNYVTLQTIYYLKEHHVIFSAQFRYYYKEHGPLAARLFNARIFLKRSYMVQICGRPDFLAVRMGAPMYALINRYCKILVTGRFKKYARALIAAIPRAFKMLSLLPHVLPDELAFNVVHRLLCARLKSILSSAYLRGFIQALYGDYSNFLRSPYADYEYLARIVILPFLSYFFIFSQNALIYRSRITHTRLRVYATHDSDYHEDMCSNVLSAVPKKDGEMRPIFKSHQNAELLLPLYSVFENEPTLNSCVRGINTDSYFFDMDNAFNEVDYELLASLLQSRLSARGGRFLAIFYGQNVNKYPCGFEILEVEQLIYAVRKHVLDFNFYDPFTRARYVLKRGIPQGNPLSSLLFKIYADYWLSRKCAEHYLMCNTSFSFVKYVDNFAITGCQVKQSEFYKTRRTGEFCTFRGDKSYAPGHSRSIQYLLLCRAEEIPEAATAILKLHSIDKIQYYVAKRLKMIKTQPIPNLYKYKLTIDICNRLRKNGVPRRRDASASARKLRSKHRYAVKLLKYAVSAIKEREGAGKQQKYK